MVLLQQLFMEKKSCGAFETAVDEQESCDAFRTATDGQEDCRAIDKLVHEKSLGAFDTAVYGHNCLIM